MTKNKSQHLVKVKGVGALRKEVDRLAKSGYFPAPMPNDFGYSRKGDKVRGTFEGFIESKLMCGDKNGGLNFPTLHLSSGGEIPVSDKIGTPGLGYMAWGQYNNNPNVITLLTEASPYTASAHRFNTDLCEGRGPRPVFRYCQYVGGNITEKVIAHRDAGVLLKGWIRDLRRELQKEQAESAQSPSSTATSSPAGSGSVAANPTASSPAGSGSVAASSADASSADSPLIKDLKEQIADLEAQYAQWKKDAAALEKFTLSNNLHLVFLSLTEDMQQHNICFPELLLNKKQTDSNKKKIPTSLWTPKIIGIRYRSAHQCRLERKDKNGNINYVYVSNQWTDTRLSSKTIPKGDIDINIGAIRALKQEDPVGDLQKIVRIARQKNVSTNKRPTRFILPVVYPSAGRPYYPVPANQSIYSGDIYMYLMTMISDRKRRRDNSNVIGRILYLNQEYMERLYHQNKADTKEARAAVFNKLRNQINGFLNDRDNMGKPLVAYTFQSNIDGKTYESWKIVEIESADKGSVEANQKELAEVSSIIFFAYGLDSRLVGNTPGDVSSHGGTDLRERYMLKQLQMSPMQQLILTPLYVTSYFNEWKTVDWEIPREVLTTLDNSKTGITTQPQE